MKKIIILSAVLALTLSLAGCRGEEGIKVYNLYYTNSQATRLGSYTYESTTDDRLALVGEFFESMASISEDSGVTIIPSGVRITDLGFSGDILVMELEGSLEGESASRQLMFYSGATRAVAQLDSISGLQINLNGSGVTDVNGYPMGIMRTSRFVNNAVDDPEDYRESEVSLFFANAAGDRLIKCPASVAYRSSTPIERVIVEKLIAGPAANNIDGAADGAVTPTLPQGLTLLGINIKDGVCYVNLDDRLIKEATTAHDDVAVYSIVNTLMQLDTITSVQITINGVSEITMPMGQINLNQPFVFNEMLVEMSAQDSSGQ